MNKVVDESPIITNGATNVIGAIEKDNRTPA
jgi:hypothetical protein